MKILLHQKILLVRIPKKSWNPSKIHSYKKAVKTKHTRYDKKNWSNFLFSVEHPFWESKSWFGNGIFGASNETRRLLCWPFVLRCFFFTLFRRFSDIDGKFFGKSSHLSVHYTSQDEFFWIQSRTHWATFYRIKFPKIFSLQRFSYRNSVKSRERLLLNW